MIPFNLNRRLLHTEPVQAATPGVAISSVYRRTNAVLPAPTVYGHPSRSRGPTPVSSTRLPLVGVL